MDLSKFAAPLNAPSVYYLSNPKNLDERRQKILEDTFKNKKPEVLTQLIAYSEEEPQSSDNQLFTIHTIHQLIKTDKKKRTPPFIRRISTTGKLTDWEETQLLPYLKEVYKPLNNIELPNIEIEVNELAYEQFISRQTQLENKLSQRERQYFLKRRLGEIFYEFYRRIGK